MLPLKRIATTKSPDGSEIGLLQRGDEWLVQVGGVVLMSSRAHASEEALAERALRLHPKPKDILVGGLGLGFTLRAVLEQAAKDVRVTVAELLAELVEWNRTHLLPLNGTLLTDPRCTVSVGDVSKLICDSKQRFDVILLDIDNGPVALTDEGNHALYGKHGVKRCYDALRPKGVLALWSNGPNPRYEERLGAAGFRVTSERVAAVKGHGARHVLHLAVRP